MDESQQDKQESPSRDPFRWLGIGVEFALVVVMCSMGGLWLDKAQDPPTTPGFMIMGFFVGFGVMLYTIFKRAGGWKNWKDKK